MTHKIYPKKLSTGDNIRVIAPSRSLGVLSKDQVSLAIKRLTSDGFQISFGKHVHEMDDFASSSVSSRLEDLHNAFQDSSVDAILSVIGGFNSNQLLEYIDYDMIAAHPKILCGYSDISALSNAIYAKTGLVGYSGPHFSIFGMQKGFDVTHTYFKSCLASEDDLHITSAPTWSDDAWYIDQNNRTFLPNDGMWDMTQCHVTVEGTLIGGHLRCLNALQGTSYMPSLKDTILLIEEDEEILPPLFDRQLQSIIHQPDFPGIRAILIGRFQKKSAMTRDLLTKIIQSKTRLCNIPVIANCDFGHTSPIFTFPIGGDARLDFDENKNPTLTIYNKKRSIPL